MVKGDPFCSLKESLTIYFPYTTKLGSSKEQYDLWTSAILKAWSQDPDKRPTCNGQVLLNSIKEICRVIDPSFSENITDGKSSFTVPKFEHPQELINLELHQDTAMEVMTEIAADSIKKTGDVTPQL